MMWQDVIMTLGQFVFFIALIPIIKATEKPTVSTCLITAIVLTVYIPTLWTLSLFISVAATSLVALAWWVLFFQSWLKPKARTGEINLLLDGSQPKDEIRFLPDGPQPKVSMTSREIREWRDDTYDEKAAEELRGSHVRFRRKR